MKKTVLLLLSVCLIFALAACSGSEKGDTDETNKSEMYDNYEPYYRGDAEDYEGNWVDGYEVGHHTYMVISEEGFIKIMDGRGDNYNVVGIIHNDEYVDVNNYEDGWWTIASGNYAGYYIYESSLFEVDE